LPIGGANGNHISARKIALHGGHANGQQAFPLQAELGQRTDIYRHRAAQLQVVHHPLLAGLLLLRRRHQQGAHGFALGQAQQHICFTAPSDDGGSARTSGALGSQDFGDHPALAQAGACATGHVL
jgi:hypothetical protein